MWSHRLHEVSHKETHVKVSDTDVKGIIGARNVLVMSLDVYCTLRNKILLRKRLFTKKKKKTMFEVIQGEKESRGEKYKNSVTVLNGDRKKQMLYV